MAPSPQSNQAGREKASVDPFDSRVEAEKEVADQQGSDRDQKRVLFVEVDTAEQRQRGDRRDVRHTGNKPGKRCEQDQRNYNNAANHTISFREGYIQVLVKTFSQMKCQADTQIIHISPVPVKPDPGHLNAIAPGNIPTC